MEKVLTSRQRKQGNQESLAQNLNDYMMSDSIIGDGNLISSPRNNSGQKLLVEMEGDQSMAADE